MIVRTLEQDGNTNVVPDRLVPSTGSADDPGGGSGHGRGAAARRCGARPRRSPPWRSAGCCSPARCGRCRAREAGCGVAPPRPPRLRARSGGDRGAAVRRRAALCGARRADGNGAGPRTIAEANAKRPDENLLLEDLRRTTHVVAAAVYDLLTASVTAGLAASKAAAAGLRSPSVRMRGDPVSRDVDPPPRPATSSWRWT